MEGSSVGKVSATFINVDFRICRKKAWPTKWWSSVSFDGRTLKSCDFEIIALMCSLCLRGLQVDIKSQPFAEFVVGLVKSFYFVFMLTDQGFFDFWQM